MKKIIFLFALLIASPLAAFNVGVGFSWNTIDEKFSSNLHTNEDRSGQDRYQTDKSRFAPVVQLGHRFSTCICNDWSVGVMAQWKYLNYKTPNENSSRGQILPNATFSSINIFGDDVHRDFTSKTRLSNEVLLLGYLGREVACGYAYLGAGPVFFTASNSIFVSSVHTPNGTGDHLVSTSVKSNRVVWGGAVQLGYQYFLNCDSFLNISYTYMQTGSGHFKNTANAAQLNGFDTPGATILTLSRSIRFTTQELICSVNMMF